MTSYAKITDFASKDALLTGNPAKIVKGVEIDDEFNAIATADATSVKGPIGVTVDNTVVRWDGTTGRAVQGSGVTISDADVVTASGFTGPVGATTPNRGAFTTLSATGNITAGTGTGTITSIANGANSGTSGGAWVGAQNAGSTIAALGNYSSLLGGAYDATPTLYSTGTLKTYIVGGGVITQTSSTGLAVTGALSASGVFSLNGSQFAANSASTNYQYSDTNGIIWRNKADNTTIASLSNTGAMTVANGLTVTGIVTPEADNTRTLGTGALRWSTVYAGTGTINTSDAREKTDVASLTTAEINAAKQLSKEIGTYKFLTSVQSKGDAARTHVGMTVQRAIAIMEENGLDPFGYGFICHDVWEDKFVEHPAIDAADVVLDENGDVVTPAVEGKAAWTEQTQVAGDRYAFRYDQLTMFIAAGIEARLAALEGNA